MEHWLIADITFLDVHLQLCMLLVTGITSLWFVYVWATGSVRAANGRQLYCGDGWLSAERVSE
jgi:hypothetical protein